MIWGYARVDGVRAEMSLTAIGHEVSSAVARLEIINERR